MIVHVSSILCKMRAICGKFFSFFSSFSFCLSLSLLLLVNQGISRCDITLNIAFNIRSCFPVSLFDRGGREEKETLLLRNLSSTTPYILISLRLRDDNRNKNSPFLFSVGFPLSFFYKDSFHLRLQTKYLKWKEIRVGRTTFQREFFRIDRNFPKRVYILREGRMGYKFDDGKSGCRGRMIRITRQTIIAVYIWATHQPSPFVYKSA